MARKQIKNGSYELVLKCTKAALEKKAFHNLIFEVGKLGAFTDYFLITSGSNERQVQAIADEIGRLAKENSIPILAREGYEDGRWIVLDFGDVVIHVFQDQIREFYDLEALWSDAPRIRIPEEVYSNVLSSSSNEALASHQ